MRMTERAHVELNNKKTIMRMTERSKIELNKENHEDDGRVIGRIK